MLYSVSTDDHERLKSVFKVICRIEPSQDKDEEVERVIGVHGIGLGMDEILQGLSIAINMGATK